MIKHIILGCLCLVMTFLSYSQEVSVTSSSEMINKSSSEFWKGFLGESKTGYFLLRKGGPISNESIYIEKYGLDLKFISTNDVKSSMGIMGDSKLHRSTVMDNGQIYSFYEGWNKSIRKNSFIVKLSDDNGILQDNETVLETEPSKSQLKASNYSYSFSPNGEKLLVLTSKPFVKGEKEAIRLQVFTTSDFKSIWKKDITLENESKRSPKNYIKVNNEGVAFVFKTIKINGKENHYKIITVKDEILSNEDLDLKNNYPTQIELIIDKEDNLIVTSMLANMGQLNRFWQNTQYTKVNPKGTVLTHKVEPLGSNLLSKIVSEKNAAKPGYKLQNYKLKGVEKKSDGSLLLIIENQTNSKSTIPNTQPPAYNYTLSYGGVIVLSFDKSGVRNWNTFYDKKQSETTKDTDVSYGSFAYSLKNDKLYLVWNYTSTEVDLIKHFRFWKDKNGNKINIDNLYGAEALYPSLLTVLNNDGTFEYKEKTFESLALKEIQEPNAYLMAIDPSIYISTEKGIVILSRMKSKSAKRYKFNTITF